MQTAPTPLDHMNVNATVDIPEMDRLAQVNLITFMSTFPFYKKNLENVVR